MVGRERGAGTTTVCSSDAVNWADRKTTILREPAQSNLGRLPARREPPAMGARARAKHLPLRLPYLLVRLVFGQNVTSTI